MVFECFIKIWKTAKFITLTVKVIKKCIFIYFYCKKALKLKVNYHIKCKYLPLNCWAFSFPLIRWAVLIFIKTEIKKEKIAFISLILVSKL